MIDESPHVDDGVAEGDLLAAAQEDLADGDAPDPRTVGRCEIANAKTARGDFQARVASRDFRIRDAQTADDALTDEHLGIARGDRCDRPAVRPAYDAQL